MDTDETNIPDNYLIVYIKVGNRVFRALVDTGAQPCVIKQSCVPLGTPIVPSNLYIKGVKGPAIAVCGTANIPMEVGNKIFMIECVVIEDTEIQFPADASIIIGVNMLANNSIDVSTSRWSLMYQDQTLKKLEPARIDGVLFGAELDYAENMLITNSEVETEGNSNTLDSTPEVDINNNIIQPKSRKLVKLYPQESTLQEEQYEVQQASHYYAPDECEENIPQSMDNIGEEEIPPNIYTVAPEANISLPPSTMCMIKVAVRDLKGFDAPNTVPYEVKGGILTPGVLALQGVSNQRDSIAVINYTSEEFNLYRNVPFTAAYMLEDEDVATITCGKHIPNLFTTEVYTLMAMSSITEEAYVSAEEYSSDTDELQEALDYDPAEISTQEVVYDSYRCKELLSLLGADKWNLTNKQRKAAESLILDNQRAFNMPGESLPVTHLIKHDIVLENDDKIVHVKPRWTPIHQRAPVEVELDGLLKHSLAVPTTSAFSSPIVLVKKKDKGKFRLAVDFREVNKNTVPMFFPVNNIEEIIYKVALSKIHSRFDLKNGFMQIALYKRAMPRSAFSCHKGHFMFTRMPFGLVNAPHSLNKLMNMVFGHLTSTVSHFFDDIFVHSDSVEMHLPHLDEALKALIDANLQVSPEKTCMFTKEVAVLGHIAGGGFIKPGLDKLQAVRQFPVPKTRTDIRSFLGLTGFYRRFIKNYAFHAKPLTYLTKEDVKWNWGEEQQLAFQRLKDHLMTEPVLKAPDFSRSWFLITDACDVGIAAWLGQRYNGVLHAVAYFSRQLRKGEATIRRDAMELETLAILEGLKKFRPLIWGQKIIILSDNSALQWLFKRSIYKSARLTRWALAVQGFNVEILHYPGTLNRVADSLSRNPPPLQVSEDIEDKAQTILEACGDSNVALIGLYSKYEPPTQREVLLKINAIRANEPDAEDTDLDQAWTLDELKKEQNMDILLKPIIDFINNPSDINKMKIDPNIKNTEDYFLDISGALFVRIDDKKAELRGTEEVLVIPHKFQKLAASIIHDTVLGGHAAAERTLFAAKRRFFGDQ